MRQCVLRVHADEHSMLGVPARLPALRDVVLARTAGVFSGLLQQLLTLSAMTRLALPGSHCISTEVWALEPVLLFVTKPVIRPKVLCRRPLRCCTDLPLAP